MQPLILQETIGRVSVEPLTVDQYEGMIAHGILEEGAPIELLDGLLVRKDRATVGEDAMTVGAGHTLSLKKIGRLGPRFEKYGCHLAIQAPVRIPEANEPEPDASVVAGVPEDYARRHPGPRDVFAVIEVSDSSLLRDRTTKLRIYATAGIRQYLIVNLVDHEVEVYYSPVPREGRYAAGCVRLPDGTVSIAAAQQGRTVKVRGSDLLPGRSGGGRRR